MSESYWITTLGKIHTLLWICLGVSAIAALILSCGCTLTPTTDEIYFIYGAGTIVDYCKENSKVKEIPDKAIDALNRYIDSIAEDKKGQ